MKVYFFCIAFILAVSFASCDNVKVTNKTDEEAIPVRVLGTQTPLPENPNPNPTPTQMDRKVIDYKVIPVSEVKTEMTAGWQPFGGVSAYGGGAMVQAMVKY